MSTLTWQLVSNWNNKNKFMLLIVYDFPARLNVGQAADVNVVKPRKMMKKIKSCKSDDIFVELVWLVIDLYGLIKFGEGIMDFIL